MTESGSCSGENGVALVYQQFRYGFKVAMRLLLKVDLPGDSSASVSAGRPSIARYHKADICYTSLSPFLPIGG